MPMGSHWCSNHFRWSAWGGSETSHMLMVIYNPLFELQYLLKYWQSGAEARFESGKRLGQLSRQEDVGICTGYRPEDYSGGCSIRHCVAASARSSLPTEVSCIVLLQSIRLLQVSKGFSLPLLILWPLTLRVTRSYFSLSSHLDISKLLSKQAWPSLLQGVQTCLVGESEVFAWGNLSVQGSGNLLASRPLGAAVALCWEAVVQGEWRCLKACKEVLVSIRKPGHSPRMNILTSDFQDWYVYNTVSKL